MAIQYLSIAGLSLIAAGWLYQFYWMSKNKGEKAIQNTFVAVNCLGIVLLIADSASSGMMDIVFGNVLTLLGSALVLYKASK